MKKLLLFIALFGQILVAQTIEVTSVKQLLASSESGGMYHPVF